jgi:hypothetical protein
MRLFWTVIAVLALSTGAWWMLRAPEAAVQSPILPETPVSAGTKPGTSQGAGMSGVETHDADAFVPPALVDSTPSASHATAEKPAAMPAAAPVAAEPLKAAPTLTSPPAPPAPLTAAAPTKPVAAKPAEPNPETLTDISSEMDKLLGIAPSPVPEAAKPSSATPEAPAATATKPDAAKPATGPAAPVNVKLTKQDDGSTLVDDKYIIKGTGTKEDPYRVTWEMLVSAQDTYQPRLGRKVIPDRLKMIDGKWVRISGYIAFPIMAASPDEMLMMLNQWDGCCIGVPPTPYDAIEVKLKAPAKGNDRLRTSGTLTGQFKVDPYLVKDWLVSLFVMENGELSDATGTAAQGQHAK